jgi:hypothetical protein
LWAIRPQAPYAVEAQTNARGALTAEFYVDDVLYGTAGSYKYAYSAAQPIAPAASSA